MFFDQSLISEVNTVEPYSGNTQSLTQNVDDSIFESVVNTIDPIMHYVLLGDNIQDGVLAWTTLVIDRSVEESVKAAATWTEDGGIIDSSSGGMGGSGGGIAAPGGSSNLTGANTSTTLTVSGSAGNILSDQTSTSPAATSATQSSSAGQLSKSEKFYFLWLIKQIMIDSIISLSLL